MSGFVLYASWTFMCAALLFECYILFAFARSRFGKYPPYVPTRKGVVNAIIDEISPFLEASVEPLNVVEPGCGDARMITRLARRFPHHRFTGYEWDYVPYFLAKLRTRKDKNVRIVRQNFLFADYTKDNFVIVFTGNEIAAELSQKLSADLPDKAIIISECFKIPNLTCIKEIDTAWKNYFFLPQKLFMYQIDRKAEKTA